MADGLPIRFKKLKNLFHIQEFKKKSSDILSDQKSNMISKQKTPYFYEASVPGAGIEPARDYSHKILSLACLPIPPSRLHLDLTKLLIDPKQESP